MWPTTLLYSWGGGLVDKWKQTVGYFVTTGPMNPVIVQEALLDCIDFVRSAGLIQKVVICDQGSNNRSMISNLGDTVFHPTSECNSDTIFVIYDAPHLLKNIRNNLKCNDFSVDGHRFEWKHHVSFYALDSSLPIRMAPRLTQKHVTLPTYSAMRLSLAAQVLSHSYAAGITTELFAKGLNQNNQQPMASKSMEGRKLSLLERLRQKNEEQDIRHRPKEVQKCKSEPLGRSQTVK